MEEIYSCLGNNSLDENNFSKSSVAWTKEDLEKNELNTFKTITAINNRVPTIKCAVNFFTIFILVKIKSNMENKTELKNKLLRNHVAPPSWVLPTKHRFKIILFIKSPVA